MPQIGRVETLAEQCTARRVGGGAKFTLPRRSRTPGDCGRQAA